MAIPQIYPNYNSFGVTGKNIIPEEKVLKDLLYKNRIKTFNTNNYNETQNDVEFIKNSLLPQFLKLYKKWPQAYELIMKNTSFVIGIIDSENSVFHTKNSSVPIATKLIYTRPDKCALYINKFDLDQKTFGYDYMGEGIWHEIMHAVDNFAVDDTKYKSINPLFLSDILDKKYDNKLDKIAKNYMRRLQSAKVELYNWEIKNMKATEKEKMDKYIEIMNNNRCWTARRIAFASDETLGQFNNYCFVTTKNSKEVFACGLALYFGSDEEKARLKDQEFGLYDMIERIIVPRIKNAVVKKNKA